MKRIYPAKVTNGRLIIHDLEAFRAHFKSMEGQEVDLTIGKRKKSRSNNQNRYYWGICIKLLADFIGYTDEEMHEALKMKFLLVHGDKLDTVKSTAELSTVEFESYLGQVKMFAAQLGVVIPEPNEVEF